MKLKLVDGHVATQEVDGVLCPIYIHDDNQERPYDAGKAMQTISARNREAQTNRERYEAAEAALVKFKDITDPVKALDALAKLEKLDLKKLIDAGEVDKVRDQITAVFNEKLAAKDKDISTLSEQLHAEIVGGNFARSKFISEKTILPPEVAQATFGSQFKVDGRKIQAFDSAGNRLLSKKTPGTEPDFDEAIELIIEAHPRRDQLLRGNNKPGSGSPAGGGGGGGGTGGGKTMSRQQWEQAGEQARNAHLAAGGTVVD